MIDYAAARLNMVESQLRTNKVTDPALIDAFLTIPRERFVPESLKGIAYIDEDIPLGGGRYLMEPMVLARLIQLAEPRPGERSLYLGAASGYGVAVLARLAASVVAVESDPRFAAEARRNLGGLGCTNVRLVEGPLDQGYAGEAPYDVILYGGATAQISKAVAEQLARTGRLVAVTKPDSQVGQATVMTWSGSVLSGRPSFDAATALLPGLEPKRDFVF